MQGKHRVPAVVALGLAVVSLIGLGSQCRADLEIHCLDVGQGDCTLMISPTGGTLLFDAGTNGKGNGTVIPHLQGLGIDALDYVVASHYHMDHIGGIDEVVNSLGMDSVRVAVLDRGWSYTTQTYEDYEAAVASKRTTIYDGQVIDLGGGVTVTCVAVNGNGELSPPYDDEENNYCVSLLVEYGDFEFFVAGDLSGVNSSYYYDIESSVAPEVGDIDVYRVDHHGSSSNSNITLVSTLKPEVSIISVGSNSYGHPTQTIINRLISYDSYIYQTELGSGGTIPPGDGEVVGGNVIITVNGEQYTVDGDVYDLGTSGVEIVYTPLSVSVFPNPFAQVTTFRLSIPESQSVSLDIFDVSGRLVQQIAPAPAGNTPYTVTWDGSSLGGGMVAPGVYFLRLSTPSVGISKKVVKK
jgi:beta-lactamase superfamily II metal-dependent hydrolase